MRNPFQKLPLPILLAAVGAVIASFLAPAVPTFRTGGFEPRTEPAPVVALVGAVLGLVLGLVLQGPLQRLRGSLRALRLRARWPGARSRRAPGRADGPVEVVGTLRVLEPVTSRLERVPCAAYLTRTETLDGEVTHSAAVGHVEVRGAGGIAWIEAGPCELAASLSVGAYELRVEDGAWVVVWAMASRDAQGRVVLRGDGDRRLVLALNEG